ncbi:hypothetical protein ILYODFUR_011351 [Ilyodon furcidens]|uniref:Uncharacterized protein n=1 Tax=Ilyodon furcidens TaxID=33524 RepID=A0ABV0VEQ1_9TELE
MYLQSRCLTRWKMCFHPSLQSFAASNRFSSRIVHGAAITMFHHRDGSGGCVVFFSTHSVLHVAQLTRGLCFTCLLNLIHSCWHTLNQGFSVLVLWISCRFYVCPSCHTPDLNECHVEEVFQSFQSGVLEQRTI